MSIARGDTKDVKASSTKPLMNFQLLEGFFSTPCWKTMQSNQRWIQLKTLNFQLTQPNAILVLDVDQTIYDCKKDKLIRVKKIRELIREAQNNNILVVIVTARNFSETAAAVKKTAGTVTIDSVANIVKRIGAHYFFKVYFTQGCDKQHALQNLKECYFPNDPDKRKIGLVDDLPGYLTPCANAGFHTILADRQGDYIHAIQAFIDKYSGKPKLEKTVQDDWLLTNKKIRSAYPVFDLNNLNLHLPEETIKELGGLDLLNEKSRVVINKKRNEKSIFTLKKNLVEQGWILSIQVSNLVQPLVKKIQYRFCYKEFGLLQASLSINDQLASSYDVNKNAFYNFFNESNPQLKRDYEVAMMLMIENFLFAYNHPEIKIEKPKDSLSPENDVVFLSDLLSKIYFGTPAYFKSALNMVLSLFSAGQEVLKQFLRKDFFVICERNDLATLEYIFKLMDDEKLANINFKDPVNGATALHRAAFYDAAAVVEFLIKHGADPAAKDLKNRTPVVKAAEHSAWAAVEKIVSLVKDEKDTAQLSVALLKAAENNSSKSAIQMLDAGVRNNSCNDKQQSALNFAILHNDFDLTARLLVMSRPGYSEPPLITAVTSNMVSIDMFKYLLAKEPIPQWRDKTFFEHAVEAKAIEKAKLIYELQNKKLNAAEVAVLAKSPLRGFQQLYVQHQLSMYVSELQKSEGIFDFFRKHTKSLKIKAAIELQNKLDNLDEKTNVTELLATLQSPK